MNLPKRRMGRTNLMVTELGLGAMDTPQVEEGAQTLKLALDLGINFVDTARDYQGSEYLIGRVMPATENNQFCIGSKTFHRTKDGSQYDVDRSLRTIGVDVIDLYQLHDVSSQSTWEQVMQERGALEGLQIARIRGLIRYIGISSHSPEVLEQAIYCGEFDTVMVEYSAFFPHTHRLISLANERDIGVIVMRPLGGSGRVSSIRSRIASGYDGTLTPATLLRYVLSNPDISVAIPGVRFPSRVRENVQVALTWQPLTAAEKQECEREAELLY